LLHSTVLRNVLLEQKKCCSSSVLYCTEHLTSKRLRHRRFSSGERRNFQGVVVPVELILISFSESIVLTGNPYTRVCGTQLTKRTTSTCNTNKGHRVFWTTAFSPFTVNKAQVGSEEAKVLNLFWEERFVNSQIQVGLLCTGTKKRTIGSGSTRSASGFECEIWTAKCEQV
jgi:hypothetical protein